MQNPFDTGTGGNEAVRSQIAATLAQFYGELAGTAKKPAPKFSIARALDKMCDGGLTDGYEKEVCSGAAMIAGTAHDQSRIVVPFGAIARRDATVAGSAGYLVGVANAGAADVLRPWSVTARSGITVFDNLRERVTIPRVTTAPTGQWLTDEGAAIVESTPVLGQAALTPHVYGATIEFSRLFLKQADAAEGFIRDQLLRAAGHALDLGVLNGAGSNEPLGILNHSGVGTESGSGLAWAGVCNVLETLANAGLDDSAATWVAAPGVRELLQQREVVSTSGRFVWDGADRIANRPAYCTPDMPSATLLCGDFSRAVVGIWGGALRVDLNPFQDFSKGIVAARVLLVCDLALPTPGAFVKVSSIT